MTYRKNKLPYFFVEAQREGIANIFGISLGPEGDGVLEETRSIHANKAQFHWVVTTRPPLLNRKDQT
jgi:hypothetical protein